MFTRQSASYTATVVIAVSAAVAAQAPPAHLVVTSPTLIADQPIPRQHTADGENISPAIQWSGMPATTRSFALVCDDPDVPIPGGFVHWVVYNIPGAATGVPENLPIDPSAPMPASIAGTVQGLSGFKRPIYRGRRHPRASRITITSRSMRSTSLACPPDSPRHNSSRRCRATSSARANWSRSRAKAADSSARTVRTPWPTGR